jgi:pilus assembly protein CpaB
MKNRRLGLALVIALVASVSLTWFIYSRIRRQISSANHTTKIVASAKILDPGTSLTAEDLVLVDWPAKMALEGSIAKTESLVGRIVMYPVAANEPIRESLLASPGSAIGLTAKIPDGMRAVAVETNDVNNVSGFLFPGARVDVLLTLRGEAGAESVTATVLQNIDVLTTGEKLQPDPSGKPQKVREVTLLLTPEAAQKLVLASNQGTIQFVLRNGGDQKISNQAPVSVSDLGAGYLRKPDAKPEATLTKPAIPKSPRSAYQIETFTGSKRGAVTF